MASFLLGDDEEFDTEMAMHDSENYFWMDSIDHTGMVIPDFLNAPSLQTGSGFLHPVGGSWPAGKVLEPATLLRWGFIVIEPSEHNQPDYKGIIQSIQNGAHDLGMKIAEPVVQIFNLPYKDLYGEMVRCDAENLQLLFIVIPDANKDYYHKVKIFSERFVGIPTQCVRERTARKGMGPKVIKNILLKVNTKLKGVNHSVDPLDMPPFFDGDDSIMIVGGHVIHLSPEQSSKYHFGVRSSIAAVAASFDPQCSRYNVTMSVQDPTKQEIVDIDGMLTQQLLVYHKNNRKLPATIIYYRSAMPTTLYDEVETYEKLHLLVAYARLAQASSRPEGAPIRPILTPKLIFIIVDSPRNEKLKLSQLSKETHVKPGLIINTHYIPKDSNRQTRFSMVSRKAKRAARLTNYFIFFNGGIPHTELEWLSYSLCYFGGRDTRSLTIPTPLYYARLACRRALSLTYCAKFDAKRLEEKPLKVGICTCLFKHGRMFFV